jgi:hypothetical protein
VFLPFDRVWDERHVSIFEERLDGLQLFVGLSRRSSKGSQMDFDLEGIGISFEHIFLVPEVVAYMVLPGELNVSAFSKVGGLVGSFLKQELRSCEPLAKD